MLTLDYAEKFRHLGQFYFHWVSGVFNPLIHLQEIELTEGELQLLSIQGAKKPLYDRPPEVEDDCCLIAVSSFEWTLDEKATVSLTTL